MAKLFQRTIEDFTCEHCRWFVSGSGYTNHCPQCLWSKHVDIHPGDRAGECAGLMKPIGFEKRSGGYLILHRCAGCGFERKSRFAKEDNFEVLLSLYLGIF
ncbi:MAG: RNHCP domain-containing protein [Candidatus Taylorbacteria bacterium]|nr:RNHCP domain-containing protein [Candidatus Taylorbacteria bacterium]